MRYLILKPREATIDPRDLTIKDSAHLHSLIPPIADCAGEAEAVSCVRRAYPNAQAMPFPVQIGTGMTVLLGFLEDPSRRVDGDDELPFVLFVQPQTQNERDRRELMQAAAGKAPLFDRKAWAIKPAKPALHRTVPIEWRTSELESPVFIDAQVGYEDGRLVLYAEVGSESMSITLPKNLELVERGADVDSAPIAASDRLRIVAE